MMTRNLRATFVIVFLVLVASVPLIFADAPAAQPTSSYLALVFQAQPSPTPTAVPTATPPPVLPLLNGGFEEGGSVGWESFGSVYIDRIPSAARTGEWSALMGGNANEDGSFRQYVTITAAKPYLVYWGEVESSELRCTYDHGYVRLGFNFVDEVNEFCQASEHTDYRRRVVDLRKYIGQTMYLRFEMDVDYGLASYWVIDDISFVAKP
jgi:hypothetical protein